MTARSLALALLAVALLAAPAGAAGTPTCFGAAARNPAAPCHNPSLDHSAKPSPAWAPLELNAPCHPLTFTSFPRVCWFAHRKQGASATVALLGDSHASSWRSAVAVLARSQRWHALTIRRSSCPFNEARRTGPAKESATCSKWVRAVVRWFGKHAEIHTVLVTGSAFSDVVVPAGADEHQIEVDGYREALASLPPSVTRVVVIRDTPRSSTGTFDCVSRALKAHQDLTGACALARGDVLPPDPGVEAAQQLGAPRFGVIDLSDFFCDPDRCFPVIGGALVYKDISHMTTVFGTSLGPYLTDAYLSLSS